MDDDDDVHMFGTDVPSGQGRRRNRRGRNHAKPSKMRGNVQRNLAQTRPNQGQTKQIVRTFQAKPGPNQAKPGPKPGKL